MLFLKCLLVLHVSVARAPEVFISNGHFSWRELEESTGEDGEVFSTSGELTNIDFCAEKVSNLFVTLFDLPQNKNDDKTRQLHKSK